MHRVKMSEQKDTRFIASPRARDRQVISPPVAARNSLDSATSLGITFGDVRYQTIDAINICREALDLDPTPDAVEEVLSYRRLHEFIRQNELQGTR